MVRVAPCLAAIVAIGAGCNALTGASDLRADDDGGASMLADAQIEAATTPVDSGSSYEEAEASTTADADADADACSGECGPPPSCKAILALASARPSGQYTIDDGPGGDQPTQVYCDMTTAGGGWTVVFMAPASLSSNAIDYTSATAGLLNGATEVLLAYRTAEYAIVGSTAVFDMPLDWKTAAPFKAQGTDAPLAVKIDGMAATTHTLRYGWGNFSDKCSDAWVLGDPYGRVCIADTAAPFFNGFSASTPDNCPDSTQSFNATACVTARQFSIAIR